MSQENQTILPLVGDHPALDLLNTVPKVDGDLIDSLQSDQDVEQFVALTGLPIQKTTRLKRGLLLAAARNLRETVRAAVEQRKAGRSVNTKLLNTFLFECQSHLELISMPNGELTLERKWEPHSAEQLLAPLAESAAELIVSGDFSLVRRCEDQECVLWFYDRTKSHHRRWCSMATCGNRNKVAAFRKRHGKAPEGPPGAKTNRI